MLTYADSIKRIVNRYEVPELNNSIMDSTSTFFCWREMDIPPIPPELLTNLPITEELSEAQRLALRPMPLEYLESEMNLNRYGETITPVSYTLFPRKNPALVQWMQKNILMRDDIASMVSNLVLHQHHVGTGWHPIHSDVRRRWALNYQLTTGGPAVSTSFFREQNKPLLRTRTNAKVASDTGAVNYADCEVIDSVITEPNKWYLLNVAVLHDIGPITTGHRYSISLEVTPKL